MDIGGQTVVDLPRISCVGAVALTDHTLVFKQKTHHLGTRLGDVSAFFGMKEPWGRILIKIEIRHSVQRSRVYIGPSAPVSRCVQPRRVGPPRNAPTKEPWAGNATGQGHHVRLHVVGTNLASSTVHGILVWCFRIPLELPKQAPSKILSASCLH